MKMINLMEPPDSGSDYLASLIIEGEKPKNYCTDSPFFMRYTDTRIGALLS